MSVQITNNLPPLGVKPLRIIREERARDLIAAIARYGAAGVWPDSDWVDELAYLLPLISGKTPPSTSLGSKPAAS
jgi:hypothetical protein